MSIRTLITTLAKKKMGKGGIPAASFQALKLKHLKPGEKLPKDFISQTNRVKAGGKLPKGYGQKPKANTKSQEGIARAKAAKKVDVSSGKPVVKKLTGGMIRAATKAAFKKGSKKLRGNTQSAKKRWSEDKNVGIGGRVRAAKNLTGGAKQIGDKTDQKLAKSPAATASRKQQGREAADLTQPAGGSFGKTTDRADTKIRSSKVAAKKADVFDKDLAETKELIKQYEKQLKDLKNPTGKARFPGSKSYKKRMQKIDSVQTLLTQARQKAADKKSRGGPGGKSKLTTAQRKQIKKAGGPVIKRKSPGKTTSPKVKKIMQDLQWQKGLTDDQIREMIGGPHPSGERRAKVKKKPSKVRKAKAGGVVKKAGGGMTRQGLYPAEEARSGTMSQAKRKRYMKSGGVVKRAGGGKAYNKKVMARMDAGTVAGCYD